MKHPDENENEDHENDFEPAETREDSPALTNVEEFASFMDGLGAGDTPPNLSDVVHHEPPVKPALAASDAIPGQLPNSTTNGGDLYLDGQLACSGFFEIAAGVTTKDGDKLLLNWTDKYDQPRTYLMPMGITQPNAVREMERFGLMLSDDTAVQKAFIRAIKKFVPLRHYQEVWRRGWHLRQYVTRHRMFSAPYQKEIVLSDDATDDFVVRGKFEDWYNTIGRWSVGNDNMIRMISAAACSLIQRHLGMDSLFLHAYPRLRADESPSRMGKSTLLHVVQSFTGAPWNTWKNTPSGLEDLAYDANDSSLILDEIGEAVADQLKSIIYGTANGYAKKRKNEERKTWCETVFSSGELSVREYLASAKIHMTAGQRNRCIDINVNTRVHGVFVNLHEFEDGDKLARAIRKANEETMGIAAEVFLEKFVLAIEEYVTWIKAQAESFMQSLRQQHELTGAVQGEVLAMLGHFTMRAAVGELLTKLGIVPWSSGDARRAWANAFEDWLAEYRAKAGQDRKPDLAGERERIFTFLRENPARFQKRQRGAPAVENFAGYVETTSDGTLFSIEPEVFRREILPGSDVRQIAAYMIPRGEWLPGENGRPDKKVERLADEGQSRFFVVRLREARNLGNLGSEPTDAHPTQPSYSLPPHPIPNFPLLNRATFGDCLELIRLLPDDSLDAVISSPPYAEQRSQYPGVPEKEYLKFTMDWLAAVWPKLKKTGSVLIVFSPWVRNQQVNNIVARIVLAAEAAGWIRPEELFWSKDGPPLGSIQRPLRNIEHIIWLSKTLHPFIDLKARARLFGVRSKRIGMSGTNPHGNVHSTSTSLEEDYARLSNEIIVSAGSVDRGIDHPAMFPPELARILLLTFCPPGGVVLDPFCGGGTTLLVAQSEARPYVGFDIGTGPKTGELFADICNRRLQTEAKYAPGAAIREREEGAA
jgi:site-specific DNA-methyltransferase (adenine-specific)